MIIQEKTAREELIERIGSMSIELLAGVYSFALHDKSVCIQSDADSSHHSGWYSFGHYVSDYREKQ